MLIGKERHDLGRPNNQGYPVRAIRTPEFLYVHNYKPDRWPAGNPETGYRNCDASPTKSQILGSFNEYYRMAFGKRPADELYRIQDDPECVNNLAAEPEYAKVKRKLRIEMEERLRGEGDPRLLGQGDVFDSYEYVGRSTHSYDNWLKYQRP